MNQRTQGVTLCQTIAIQQAAFGGGAGLGPIALRLVDLCLLEINRTSSRINALGPLRVVSALDRNLGDGSKVGIVTSRMGSIGDNGSGRMYSYRMTKAAANMLGVNLYHQLRPRGALVMLLHPGTVATQMTKGARDWGSFTKPAEAAAGLAAQLDSLGPDTPIEFRHADGTLLPW